MMSTAASIAASLSPEQLLRVAKSAMQSGVLCPETGRPLIGGGPVSFQKPGFLCGTQKKPGSSSPSDKPGEEEHSSQESRQSSSTTAASQSSSSGDLSTSCGSSSSSSAAGPPRLLTSIDMGKHGTFDLPPELRRPRFLAQGGFGTVAKCDIVRDAASLPGSIAADPRFKQYTKCAVKRVKMLKAEEDWEDALRLLREVHFLKFLPHCNMTPLMGIYANADLRDARDWEKLTHVYLVMPVYEPGSLDE